MRARIRQRLCEKTIWQVRIVALACLVIFIGGSSQMLANVVAASEKPSVAPYSHYPAGTNTVSTKSAAHLVHCPAGSLPYHALNRRVEPYSAGNAFRFRCVPATR